MSIQRSSPGDAIPLRRRRCATASTWPHVVAPVLEDEVGAQHALELKPGALGDRPGRSVFDSRHDRDPVNRKRPEDPAREEPNGAPHAAATAMRPGQPVAQLAATLVPVDLGYADATEQLAAAGFHDHHVDPVARGGPAVLQVQPAARLGRAVALRDPGPA